MRTHAPPSKVALTAIALDTKTAAIQLTDSGGVGSAHIAIANQDAIGAD